MSVGYIGAGEDEEDDLEIIRCERCRAVDSIRIRTSTTQRLDGGRPLVILECSCGHTWKVIGRAPVRAMVLRKPHPRAPL